MLKMFKNLRFGHYFASISFIFVKNYQSISFCLITFIKKLYFFYTFLDGQKWYFLSVFIVKTLIFGYLKKSNFQKTKYSGKNFKETLYVQFSLAMPFAMFLVRYIISQFNNPCNRFCRDYSLFIYKNSQPCFSPFATLS